MNMKPKMYEVCLIFLTIIMGLIASNIVFYFYAFKYENEYNLLKEETKAVLSLNDELKPLCSVTMMIDPSVVEQIKHSNILQLKIIKE